eukprot:TRINITY_DN7982_c0_g1_i1.p1 TRINITY_DN7982_c0_g1~~TRINITY_DN7982_c0_g1_i1.p1  ORF type:complete len:251 (-),score=24.90 TRINITY_DN7982_c0_g1_i1:116-868(-)
MARKSRRNATTLATMPDSEKATLLKENDLYDSIIAGGPRDLLRIAQYFAEDPDSFLTYHKISAKDFKLLHQNTQPKNMMPGWKKNPDPNVRASYANPRQRWAGEYQEKMANDVTQQFPAHIKFKHISPMQLACSKESTPEICAYLLALGVPVHPNSSVPWHSLCEINPSNLRPSDKIWRERLELFVKFGFDLNTAVRANKYSVIHDNYELLTPENVRFAISNGFDPHMSYDMAFFGPKRRVMPKFLHCAL